MLRLSLSIMIVLMLVSGTWAAEPALLPDDQCVDIRERHETLRIHPLRMRSLSRCYDIRVPFGSVAVVSVETTDGDPKSHLAVLRYQHGLVKQESGGTRQRLIFGDPSGDSWYQVQAHHYGFSGDVTLHLYRVDVAAAVLRGLATGLGQVIIEESINWLVCQAMGGECGASSGVLSGQAMVNRGVTLAVSTLQQRSLGQITRDMAFNEAGIMVREQLGYAGGHMMTLIMAVASEVIDSIYAH